jgi:hypothetical protein
MPNVFSSVPRNRASRTLAVLDLRIEHGGGEERTSPNGIVAMLLRGQLAALKRLPGHFSVLSQQPAVRYREDNLDIDLTPGELSRLVARNLRSHEYFALQSRFGTAFAWHDDFYDRATGDALQPKLPPGDLEDEPPIANWPRAPHPTRTALNQAVAWLVRHPMLASGHLELVRADGSRLPTGQADALTRDDVKANLSLIEAARAAHFATPSKGPGRKPSP